MRDPVDDDPLPRSLPGFERGCLSYRARPPVNAKHLIEVVVTNINVLTATATSQVLPERVG